MPASGPSRTLPPALGPFRLIACLGQGGFAPVWRAEEVYEGRKLRDVAVKLFFLPESLSPASAEAARWRDDVIDEARALCRVEHANIVRFHTLERDDAHGLVGLVMEYVPGKDLGVVLRDQGPLAEAKVLEIGISVAWALAAVHHAGLVHRDVKPENVLAAASGYKLIDFGIVVNAARAEDPAGQPPLLFGTHGYVAPEYLERRALPSPAGDLYALGVTLFMLAHGVLPSALRASPSQQRPAASLLELTYLLLDPDPNSRPRHADWVARELERLWLPSDSGRQSAPEPAAPEPPRHARGEDGGSHADAFKPNPHPPLVGRVEALASLALAAREAQQGSVRVVLLTGPLGVGRTRLLEAALDQAGFAPARTLRTHGSPERPSQLRPLLLGLRALEGGGAFLLLEGALERALSPAALPAAQQGDEALEAVEDALLVAAAEEPVVLAVDDVQWADERTLKLLQLLVERADRGARAKLLVLMAARDEPNASAPLRALLGAVRGRARVGARYLALGPLTAPQAAAVAQGVCPLDPAVERAVVRGSGRVPFFLVNALLAWCDAGAVVWRAGAFHAVDERLLDQGIPGVAALVEARLASYFAPNSPLFRSALRALAAVALHGDGLSTETLLRTFGEDEGVEEALETLVDAGILVVSGEWQEHGFAQEMVRQAALNLVRQKPWFRRLHRALLDATAQGPEAAADAAFLAAGYEKLGAREEARAWLGRARESAVRAGLFAEAVEFGDRLAALAPDAATRAAIDLATVRALVRGRQLDEARERLDRHEPAAHEVRWRILRLEVARARSEAAEDPALLADADALSDPALACEARMALAGVVPEEQALGLIDEAVALAERAGPALEFSALVLRGELVYAANRRDLRQVERDLRRALAIAHAHASIWQQIHIEGDLAVIEADLGQADAAIERLRRLADQAEARGMRGQLRMLLNNLSTCLLREGRASEASAVAQRTADLAAEAGDPTLHGTALSLRAEALFCTGDLEAALASASEADWLQRERDDRMRAHTLLRRADILEAMGRMAAALADALEAQDTATLHGEMGTLKTAVLWEKLYRARRGEVPASELREALAEVAASGVEHRRVTRQLMARVAAWLGSATSPLAR